MSGFRDGAVAGHEQGVTLSTPDSTGRVAPVIQRASSLARNARPAHVPTGARRRAGRLRAHGVHGKSARGPGWDTEWTIGG